MDSKERNLIRIATTASDERGRTGGDINGPPQWHYACHVASALYLIAEGLANGFGIVSDRLEKLEITVRGGFNLNR